MTTDEQMTTTIRIPVGHRDKPEYGHQFATMLVPPELVTPLPDSPGMSMALEAELTLMTSTIMLATKLLLREATWWVTRDPAVVRQRGLLHHDCDNCRVGVEWAEATMAADPDAVVAVGYLSWCERA